MNNRVKIIRSENSAQIFRVANVRFVQLKIRIFEMRGDVCAFQSGRVKVIEIVNDGDVPDVFA
jgi:hypothetical protein